MRAICRDHGSFEILLQILMREVDLYEGGGVLDDGLLRRLVDYFLNYPDLVHHPKEDLVFSRLRARDPVEAALLDLQWEHTALGARTRGFAAAVYRITRDPAAPRDWFAGAARGFVDAYRRHIALEEEWLFPAALGALSDRDWAEIDARSTGRRDPLFDVAIESGFEAGRHDIESLGRLPAAGREPPGARRQDIASRRERCRP